MTFRVRPNSAPAEISFVCPKHPSEVQVLEITPDGATDVTIVVGADQLPHWKVVGGKAGIRGIEVAPGAKVSFSVTGGNHGLIFLDKEQLSHLLTQESRGTEFRYQQNISTRQREMKRRLEYVGFSTTQQKIYLSRQYNIEIYDLDGAFGKEIVTGGGCTKYPISLVTGVLDDRVVLYGDTDGGIFHLDPGSGRCVSLARKFNQILINFDSNETGNLGAMVFKDRSAAIVIIDENISRQSLIYLPAKNVLVAKFRPGTGDQLLTTGEDGRVAMWQVGRKTPQEIRVYRNAGKAIGFADYVEAGKRIVAVDNSGDVYVWDADTGAPLRN